MQRIRLLRWMISINIINVLVVMLILTTACITIRPAAATAWPFHPPSSTVRHTGIAEASSSSHPWLVIIEAIMDPVPWILLQGIPAKWLALISLLPPFINRLRAACFRLLSFQLRQHFSNHHWTLHDPLFKTAGQYEELEEE